MKTLLRKILQPLFYFLYYIPFKKSINVTRDSKPLKLGITAVVAMKNEEYTLPLCLESLIGFADQIVIIDNGSEDSSLEKAKEFKEKFSYTVEVDIIEMPGALLGDCREAGLKATRYQWHLRWDADMVAHTDGPNDMKLLRNKILCDDTPKAIQLPRVNLNGDLVHCNSNKVIDEGEPILIWFNKHVYYKEYGKFDTIKLPFYFLQEKEKNHYYFHCQGLKSIENLIHRFHYFVWREYSNLFINKALPENLKSLDKFKEIRNLYLFETNEKKILKYRYTKQWVKHFTKFDNSKFGKHPALLEEEIKNENHRFQIIYENNKPIFRIDAEDNDLNSFFADYDKKWKEDDFFNKLNEEKIDLYI